MNRARVAMCIIVVFALSSCANNTPRIVTLRTDQSALNTMEHISNAAKHCWFNSHDTKFRHYLLAPELQSYSGRPRILIVPDSAPGERPVLVIEAEGEMSAKLSAYGPLLNGRDGKVIANDIVHWAKRTGKCR